MSFFGHSSFLPVIKKYLIKQVKLGNITTVPYIFAYLNEYSSVSTESCFAELFYTDINSHSGYM